jgi:hypothetical protein
MFDKNQNGNAESMLLIRRFKSRHMQITLGQTLNKGHSMTHRKIVPATLMLAMLALAACSSASGEGSSPPNRTTVVVPPSGGGSSTTTTTSPY